MRLCIDATPLLLRSAGVKNYVYHWVRSLRDAGPSEEISLFPFFSGIGALDHERSVTSPLATIRGIALLQALNRTGLPLLDIAGARWDLFHASHQLRNPPRKTPFTTSIHDMTCWLMPQYHRPRVVKGVRWFGETLMPKAAALIAISESARNDAIRILRLDPERVAVIYPGIDQRFFDAQPGRSARPYFLFVSTIEPRKNVGRMLDAWESLPASVREEYDLVVAGPEGWGESATLSRLRSGTPGVRYLGYVAESRLPSLTAGAGAFVFPSLYEGFGFPLAQALACGVPSIASNVSSIPEVAGDAALLIDPKSTQEIATAMLRLATSPSLRAELAAKARGQAERFRWQVCGRQSLEFFRKVAGR